MATPRSSRSSSSSTPVQSRKSASSRQKRVDSSEKKSRRSKQAPHRENSHGRSLNAVVRRIAGIKRKLVDEAPSHEILDDFFEGVTGEPAFTFDFYLGPPWLQDAIARACEELLDKPTGESTVYLIAVPEHDLVHGSVVMDGYLGTALFFEDIGLGAIGLYPEQQSRGGCFARLIMVEEPRGPSEAMN